jgi:hypothetical protein
MRRARAAGLPALLPGLAALLAARVGAPEALTGTLAAVAWWIMPGVGWSRAEDPLRRTLDTLGAGMVVAGAAVLAGGVTGLGPTLGWGVVLGAAWLGARRPVPRPRPLTGHVRAAVAGIVAAVAVVGWMHRDALERPLARHAWRTGLDEASFAGEAPRVGGVSSTPDGALRPLGPVVRLVGPMRGPVLLAFEAPVGATLTLDADTPAARTVGVEAAPVEDPDEGPVPRYLDRGTVLHRLDGDLAAGESRSLRLSAPERSALRIIPSSDALWELHARGVLRVVHYYQLLNMEEQVRWARELWAGRRVTDVQPPLGAWLAAGPLATTGGDLPTQAGAFLVVLGATGLAMVAVLAAWSPGAPVVAWLLPALATVQIGRLMLEPGSHGMPDTLALAASLAALAALPDPGPRWGIAGMLAQLARYHAGLLVLLPALLTGRAGRAAGWLGAVAMLLAAVAALGAASGSLAGWIETVRWEIGPEHWHGDTDAAVLLARVPGFATQALRYGGFLPLAALLLAAGEALRRGRAPSAPGQGAPGTRVLLGSLAGWCALVATIDHQPSHYQLPVVALGTLAFSAACAPLRGAARTLVPLAGVAGLGWACAAVAITG